MDKQLLFIFAWIFSGSVLAQTSGSSYQIDYEVSLKTPGNPARSYPLVLTSNGQMKADEQLPLTISEERKSGDGVVDITLRVEAQSDCYFNIQGAIELTDFRYDDTYFYLPGFWYRKNLRSPENAPSARVSKSWIVREDRLSTPLSGAYDQELNKGYNLIRMDKPAALSLKALDQGEVILSGPTDLGALGFGENSGNVQLSFAVPYREAPHSYYRKLTLGDPVTTYLPIRKGEELNFSYRLISYDATDYAGFVEQSWTQSFEIFQPKPVSQSKFTDTEIKQILTNFFRESFIDDQELKGYSGVHLETATCEKVPLLEVGFVGRVLLNAFNSLEFAYQQKDDELIRISREIWDSYEKSGFTTGGFFREVVDYRHDREADVFSIRRQSEGLYAAFFYLNFEKQAGRDHPQWESRLKSILEHFARLQLEDGSFPRKFEDDLTVVDETGGSSPCAVLPLVMAYQYFGDKKYLEMARKVAIYQEKEIISKSDYFSSTLDANCEDKEASLYSATSLYYLAQVTRGKERQKYIQLAKKASYFALSWYYTWDVPFAQGQMHGDLGLKTRGWGNVSVENNHIDVYIFEFDEILDWLARETGETRFSAFAEVIRSSMREQLLPYEGHMVGIAKTGFYPEVVQHTAWDYGRFGKGFYNDLFAPGWTVASIWELLTEGRTEKFFSGK